MAVSQYWTKEHYASLGVLDASGANTVVYAPGETVHVKRLILVTTVAQTGATSNITVAVRNVDDTGSSTVGTFTLVVAGSALNRVLYVDLADPSATGYTASDGSLIYQSYDPGGLIVVNPGQELSITSDGGGTTGSFAVYVEYVTQGFDPERLEGAVERPFTPA